MAAIAIGDCTVSILTPLAGVNLWSVVTPSSASNADTVDVSTVASSIYSCSALAETDGLLTAAVSSAGVVTLPGATGTEARTIYIFGK